MNILKRALGGLLLCTSLVATPALAVSSTADQSDLWWADPAGSEDGWGIQFVQSDSQTESIIFATMYVYGKTGAPTWYFATLVKQPVVGALTWSGDLFTSTGSWFGDVPYNSGLFQYRRVGTMTFSTPITSATSIIRGNLSYDVDGVSVAKKLIRQTLRNEDYRGHFGGAVHEFTTGCPNPSNNGTSEPLGTIDIAQQGTLLTLNNTAMTGGNCTYTGVLQQFGRMGDVVGNYSCQNGWTGTFHIYEFQVNEFGVSGRFTKTATTPLGCQSSGWFGGVLVTTF